MTKRIFTDTEYWELKDECQGILASAEQESDPKAKKRLIKSVDEIRKIMHDYETRKLKDVKALAKKEKKLNAIRTKTRADRKVFFNISAAESAVVDYASLTEKERNRLSVKKASLIEMMGKGMFIRLCNDPNLYQIRKDAEYLDGMPYISTAKYGDITVQDVALLIERYYYESELARTGHKL